MHPFSKLSVLSQFVSIKLKLYQILQESIPMTEKIIILSEYLKTRHANKNYGKRGYNHKGIDINGFDRIGLHIATNTIWDEDGYDREGYNRKGFDRYGKRRFGLGEILTTEEIMYREYIKNNSLNDSENKK